MHANKVHANSTSVVVGVVINTRFGPIRFPGFIAAHVTAHSFLQANAEEVEDDTHSEIG